MRCYTLRVVTSAFTGHRRRFSAGKKGSVNSISSTYRLRKPAKIFFNITVMVLFGNKFTKVMSQHAGNECNGTHLIQCRRVNFKRILNNEKMRTVLASNRSVERSIAKYS